MNEGVPTSSHIFKYLAVARGRVNLTASPSYVTKFYMRFDNTIMHEHKKN
jgi:hypothetical protein